MRTHFARGATALAMLLCGIPAAALGQATHVHGAPADTSASHATSEMHHDMGGMDMSGMDMSGDVPMNGLYGEYPMTREASGTAWQPDDAAHQGIHLSRGAWMLMLHGMADLVFDQQGGPRGNQKVYSGNMLMGMARRPAGPGTLGIRTMISIEPATIGQDGYPLLLQTGETANGRTPLIDRQHPHDLFMELAGTYRLARGTQSIFVYAGLPGEPALGPPAFMHRFSGMSLPEAPITHHWLDSTHITYGVLTGGAVVDRVKVEASAFRGREPDENRWNIETPKLDSDSFRLSINPTHALALQASYGRIESPEQLEPDVDQERTTASAIMDGSWSGGRWEGTVAWGRNRNRPGHTLGAFMVEGAATFAEVHNLFARIEQVEKEELFLEPDPRAGQPYEVGELSAGYRRDFLRGPHVAIGIGALGTVAWVPASIHDVYGSSPVSVLIFAHLGLR